MGVEAPSADAGDAPGSARGSTIHPLERSSMTGAGALSGGARRVPNDGSEGAESGAAARPRTAASPSATPAAWRWSVSSLAASALREKLRSRDIVDVDGAVGEIRLGQAWRGVPAGQRRPQVGHEVVESRPHAGAHGRGEGVVTHHLRASVVVRIGEHVDQDLLELDVEIDLVRDPWAGDDELVALCGGGGDIVFELRVVRLELVDPQDGDLLVRNGEGIHAVVERPDHHLVVPLLPGREPHAFRGPCRFELEDDLVELPLQPSPQPDLVDVRIDRCALRPDRRAGELVGAGRELGERAVHHSPRSRR